MLDTIIQTLFGVFLYSFFGTIMGVAMYINRPPWEKHPLYAAVVFGLVWPITLLMIIYFYFTLDFNEEDNE